MSYDNLHEDKETSYSYLPFRSTLLTVRPGHTGPECIRFVQKFPKSSK